MKGVEVARAHYEPQSRQSHARYARTILNLAFVEPTVIAAREGIRCLGVFYSR
jgi:hypothetical protein